MHSLPSKHSILNNISLLFVLAYTLMFTARASSSSIAELVKRVQSLPGVKQRAVNSVIGQAVADAASRPLHWVYDRALLESTLSSDKNADSAFWPVSVSPFYAMPTGRRSCYNEVALAMLRALPHDPMAAFDRNLYLDIIQNMFSPDSEYAEAYKRRIEAYDPSRKNEARKAIEGPWQHAAVTFLLEHLKKGEEVTGNPSLAETDGFCSSVPLVAR